MSAVTGIIMAGGKSSRMGTDKGLLHFDGKPMVQHVIEAVASVTKQLIVVANNPEYERFGWPVEADRISNCGPLGGIYTGLLASTTAKNIVVACDLPFINEGLLRYLIDESEGADVAISTHHQHIEPLVGVYHKSCITPFEKALKAQQLKLTEVFRSIELKQVPVHQCSFYSEQLFRNINTKEELNQ